MHDWSILSTPSDMVLDRVRRREMVSGVFMIERDNESGEALYSITDWAVHTSKKIPVGSNGK